MATLFPFPSSKPRVRAMTSANWLEVPGGKGFRPYGLKIGDYCISSSYFFHPRQSCFHQCTRFPQDWSEDFLTILLPVLSSGPRFLARVKGERALGGRQEGGRVKNLTRGYN